MKPLMCEMTSRECHVHVYGFFFSLRFSRQTKPQLAGDEMITGASVTVGMTSAFWHLID